MNPIFHKSYQQWLEFLKSHNLLILNNLLSDEVVFHSPVVWTPQVGKQITILYLIGASEVLREDFKYVKQIIDEEGKNWMLEFSCKVGDVSVKGVDIIQLNDEGKIIDFEVMVRPLKAINAVHAAMGMMMEKMK